MLLKYIYDGMSSVADLSLQSGWSQTLMLVSF